MACSLVPCFLPAIVGRHDGEVCGVFRVDKTHGCDNLVALIHHGVDIYRDAIDQSAADACVLIEYVFIVGSDDITGFCELRNSIESLIYRIFIRYLLVHDVENTILASDVLLLEADTEDVIVGHGNALGVEHTEGICACRTWGTAEMVLHEILLYGRISIRCLHKSKEGILVERAIDRRHDGE